MLSAVVPKSDRSLDKKKGHVTHDKSIRGSAYSGVQVDRIFLSQASRVTSPELGPEAAVLANL